MNKINLKVIFVAFLAICLGGCCSIPSIANQLGIKCGGASEAIAPAPSEPIYKLPFGVKMDGQNAVVEKNDETFARIKNPVPANASMVFDVDVKDGQIIINIFKSDDKGNASQENPAIIMGAKGSNKTALNKTMDKRKLAPGTYLMNVVGSGETSRVMFTVK
ncbi:MAG: hypothetical protein HQK79_06325 [Desulfobacterales bacterium]|nr:hypothetical protein [Desulfobacterales bacterium]MBF0397267.1 hypothetical protein [Desulfobacterales bacterium]